ncbi:CHAT domain-containing protein [Janthinobacterium sp. SUN033]|uniref:CHAT domain-containing protein n=1 Tax=Janthinobacterium sp. SUN033 TaxID=3002439 RepID=UPI0025B217F0|nr:CHAT domain-containing protein [Janthinobacterium sp. SUN033]MDN2677673.1 CHAT domain-containing protein [Janthinobacterium sp. SUN033]
MDHTQNAAEFSGFDPRSQFANANFSPLGQGDFLAGGDAGEVLGRMAACYLGFRRPEGDPLFDGILVIAPPMSAWSVSDETIAEMLASGLQAIWGTRASEVAAGILGRVVIHRCQRLESDEVVAAFKVSGPRRICLIPEASRYRDGEALVTDTATGLSRTVLSEDIWVPHVVRLATASLAVAKDTENVLVFHSEEPLLKDESMKLLADVEQLFPGVLVDEHGKTPKKEFLTQLVPRWVTMAVAGRSVDALHELEQAGLSAEDQREVRLNIAVRVKDRPEVLRLLRECLDKCHDLTSESAVSLGRVAHRFSDMELAQQFFSDALTKGLNGHMALVLVLDASTSIGDERLVRESWDRMVVLFPNDKYLDENRECRLVLTCEVVNEVTGSAPSRVGFDRFESYLADALYQKHDPDYRGLFDYVVERWPEKQTIAALCLALHASNCRSLEAALNFAVVASGEEAYAERAAWILLNVLKRMFLQEIRRRDGMEIYKVPLLLISRYLSNHPGRGQMRAELAEVVSVESAGQAGLAVLASFVLDVIGTGAPMVEASQACQRSEDSLLNNFFADALIWMSEQPAIEPGVTKLPARLLTDDANRLLSGLQALLQMAARMDDTPEQLDAIEKLAYMICLLQPFAPGNNTDLSALRLFAAKCWYFGRAQRARDVAEQILQLAGSTPERSRLAWGCYADILHFTGSPIDALIGLACASVTDTKLSAADLYQEAYVLLRVTRDLHYLDLARQVLPTCRSLYEIEGVGDLGRQRLDGIELSLDVVQASEQGEANLVALLERTRLHCAEVMAGKDELFSAASHFLQIAGMVERMGGSLSLEAVALRAELEGRQIGLQLRTVSTAFPTPEEVVDLHNQLQAARYSEDTASDQRTVVVAAHRLLLPREPEISAAQAAVAVELLSDRAIRQISESPIDVDWPGEFISKLSLEGLSVLMLAMDSGGELVGAFSKCGEVTLVRPRAYGPSFARRLSIWSADYPYKYGLVNRDAGNNEIYSSMTKLDLNMPDARRLLVVAQPALQQIPFNIGLIDGNFAGTTIAIGSAPSLTWFREVRGRQRSDASRRLAWISCAPQSEAYGTLEMLYARMSPVFEQYGFETDTSGSIPVDTRGANLVVVTAHGQLTADGRFIHRIADEQGLVESPQILARALAGVELVILFVCSGGRVDQHPLANTTVSLPKMLLDRGCRVVIASPWPLDSVVPGNWLERFLEAWDGGDSVIDANFKANQYVSERLGPEAPLYLAMTVYGDVLLSKASGGLCVPRDTGQSE